MSLFLALVTFVLVSDAGAVSPADVELAFDGASSLCVACCCDALATDSAPGDKDKEDSGQDEHRRLRIWSDEASEGESETDDDSFQEAEWTNAPRQTRALAEPNSHWREAALELTRHALVGQIRMQC